MATPVEMLHAQIERAWQSAEHPGAFEPHCQRPDCPSIAAYFRSKTWQQVGWREMKRACGASWDGPWNFLPDNVFRYFLPAFLTMYLRDARRLDVLAHAIVDCVCPHDGWRARIEPLSDQQGAAILAFLHHVAEAESDRGRCNAGIKFWEQRLGSRVRNPETLQ